MSEVLLSLFENFDGNQDGYLNTNDIGRVLSKLSIPISDDEFRGLMEKLDSDGDGKVSFQDFYQSFYEWMTNEPRFFNSEALELSTSFEYTYDKDFEQFEEFEDLEQPANQSKTIAEQQTEIEHLNEQVDNLLKEQNKTQEIQAKEQQINDERVSNLQTTIQELKKELLETKRKLHVDEEALKVQKDFAEENDHLKQKIMDQKDEIRDLKYQNSKIKGEKEKLENELIESQRKALVLKNTIEKLENTLAESRKEYKSKSKVLKEKILELEASLEVQTGIAKEVSTMKFENNKLRSQLDDHQRIYSETLDEINLLKHKLLVEGEFNSPTRTRRESLKDSLERDSNLSVSSISSTSRNFSNLQHDLSFDDCKSDNEEAITDPAVQKLANRMISLVSEANDVLHSPTNFTNLDSPLNSPIPSRILPRINVESIEFSLDDNDNDNDENSTPNDLYEDYFEVDDLGGPNDEVDDDESYGLPYFLYNRYQAIFQKERGLTSEIQRLWDEHQFYQKYFEDSQIEMGPNAEEGIEDSSKQLSVVEWWKGIRRYPLSYLLSQLLSS